MIPQPPPGQGPIDPRTAFAPPLPTAQGFPNPGPMPGPVFQQQQQPQSGLGYPPGMMPPGMMPPGMIPPPMFMPPPPRRRGGAGRAILLTLLVLGLFLSILGNIVLLAEDADGAGGTKCTTVSNGDAGQKVAVVPLHGIIESNAARLFDQNLDQVDKDKAVKALVIEIDTPGGTVTASDEIYERLRRFKASRNIPIVVSMGSMATSGGYYAACGADYIFAEETTITGNIGVLSPRFNFSKLMEKYGVEETTIVATGATYKNAGSSFAKETPAERAYWQGLIDSAYTRFKDVVQQGRGNKLTANMADVANGKAYSANEALAMGLIDQKGYPEDAYKYAATTAGLSNPRVVRYERQVGLMDLLLSSKSNARPMGASAGANGINVNFDAGLLEELSTPRLLYLWTR
jgi:protease-4